jgi:Tol biopolymer transport system component/tRNA A-37 threonylcarbamoyl transferase component Bud32
MPLSAGAKLGPYEIVAAIGAGGMGEVWKARDTRLGRFVAIKTAKNEFSERFEREARAVAALNHPRICQLYDVASAPEGFGYLVMEYVEGTPLKGPLPLDQALDYAAQMCDALDAAHKKGITHRDLKPSNILVTKSGIKLLDFGLAKIGPVAEPAGDATLTLALTGKTEIVGTLVYMSPEQLSGKEADSRSDIFSFGLVLYEMLVGKRAFEGASAASIIAAILERPAPSISGIAPAALDRTLKRCLEKDPDSRWQSARDVKAELEWIANTPLTETVATARRPWQWLWPSAAVVALAALVLLAFVHFREGQAPEPATVRFQIPAPGKSGIVHFNLSPDGRTLALTSGGSLWIRPLDALQARSLEGTEGAETMFWSPDNQFIAFVAQGKLKKIPAAGGPVQILCDASQALGGTWNRDGVILFPVSVNLGLFRIPQGGGTPIPLSKPGSSDRIPPSIDPQFLPDGTHFLFSNLLGTAPGIYAGTLEGSTLVRIAEGRFSSYVPAAGTQVPDGFLVFERNRQVMAQRFDAGRLKVSGDAVPLAEGARIDPLSPNFSVSENGTLVFAPAAGASAVQLVWLDRAGKPLGGFSPPGVYDSFRLAPDQKRIVFTDRTDANTDVWVFDSTRGVRSRLTFDPAIDDPPIWSPDGLHVVWASNRGGSFDLYEKAANGVGSETLLVKMGTPSGWPEDWSADGRYLMYQIPGAKTGQDLWIAPQAASSASGGQKPFPYLQTMFDEEHGRFSPDARWIAYSSNESGRSEVYVQSFPMPGTKFQISSNGGSEPEWRKDGTELFYIGGEGGMLMAAPIKLGRSASEPLQPGQSKPLFPLPFVSSFIVRRSYDVSNDGQRFLVPVLPAGAAPPPLTVVLNWQTQMKK